LQGRVRYRSTNEQHLLAAARYIALNSVIAGLVNHAEDWPWSSARAHLAGEDHELATVAPLRVLIPDFAALLNAPADPRGDSSDRVRPPSDDRWGAGMDRGARAAARLPPCTLQTRSQAEKVTPSGNRSWCKKSSKLSP
jgi:hypothetical protein